MEAAAAAVEREGKSVLDALKDLHTHFGAAAGPPQADAPEGPSRLGKVRLNCPEMCTTPFTGMHVELLVFALCSGWHMCLRRKWFAEHNLQLLGRIRACMAYVT